MPTPDIDAVLSEVAERYRASFVAKKFENRAADVDVLMSLFGVSSELKEENRQYWGRELGMCWQRLVVALAAASCQGFQLPPKFGGDEPCDLIVGSRAIDTKYRSGNGDSGTLKKFRAYGKLLKAEGYEPIMLFLRTDNLPAAMTAIKAGGWKVLMGKESFDFLQELSGFDLHAWMLQHAGRFNIGS